LTPVEWDSSGNVVADHNLRSFLFTLQNPHNTPARRFALEARAHWQAILCDFQWRPRLGSYDFAVSDGHNADTSSCTSLGDTDDSGQDGRTVLTGSKHFEVKEIEVFEVMQ
jgi:hypothetical protein